MTSIVSYLVLAGELWSDTARRGQYLRMRVIGAIDGCRTSRSPHFRGCTAGVAALSLNVLEGDTTGTEETLVAVSARGGALQGTRRQ